MASMTRSVSRMRGSSGARSPKRTSASASGLTSCDARSADAPGGRFLIGTKPSSGDAAPALSAGAMRT
jgi:hypothetical protein